MTETWNWFYLINLACIFLSWHWAKEAFANGNKIGGWFNVFASALNAAIVLNYIF